MTLSFAYPGVSMEKMLIGSGGFVGSVAGGYLPMLWGGSMLSLTSILLGVLGGILGIWFGYKVSKYLGFL